MLLNVQNYMHDMQMDEYIYRPSETAFVFNDVCSHIQIDISVQWIKKDTCSMQCMLPMKNKLQTWSRGW